MDSNNNKMFMNTLPSPFDSYRLQVCPHYSFDWACARNYVSLDPTDFLYEGNLWECLEDRLNLRHLTLTRDLLLCTSIAPITNDVTKCLKPGRSYIYYIRLINPSMKKIKEHGKYGFSLITDQNVRKFLCPSKDEMLTWCQWLKEVCILENIESKYELGKTVGSGSSAYVRIGKSKEDSKEYAIKSILKRKFAGNPYPMVCFFPIVTLARNA